MRTRCYCGNANILWLTNKKPFHDHFILKFREKKYRDRRTQFFQLHNLTFWHLICLGYTSSLVIFQDLKDLNMHTLFLSTFGPSLSRGIPALRNIHEGHFISKKFRTSLANINLFSRESHQKSVRMLLF